MRACSAELKTHLQGETLTIALCCRVTRTDEQVFGFTQHSGDLLFEGVLYSSGRAVSSSELVSSASMSVNNMELTGALDSEAITEADLVAGLWDYAAAEFFIVNYEDLSMGSLSLSSGTFGEITATDTEFRTELRGLMQSYSAKFGRSFLAPCDADWGDARCGLVPSEVTDGEVTVTVTAVISQRQVVCSGTTQDTEWFDYGKFRWTAGSNANATSMVKTFVSGGSFLLQLPLPYEIQEGDTAVVHAGCDKTAAMCKGRYGNKINYRGFDKIPGRDRMLSGLE